MSRRSLNDVRSYFFREAIARRSPVLVERYTLADFRYLWAHANVAALEWRRQALNRWDPATRSWARPWRSVAATRRFAR